MCMMLISPSNLMIGLGSEASTHSHSPLSLSPTRTNKGLLDYWIMLIRRQRNNPRDLPKSYKRVRELPEACKVKEEIVLKETGLKDEDLPWKTIIDPYGHHR
ncbi:hypothetical protein SERLA73DRAFT_185669 [Serpula lacrymans var. lacrymans S7.3]|uniref:Uncharacterized protein n=2 Tax=Serpula lacrymans var. lacrymans TaxID=341189 RepID=F8Q676_SERL3|nr:uncharacterized protein SERLADRAFT_474270 [Serpula lacrymans var. lacrymans S7.9]EGN96114.1 hypothetical protein SERLA73DRAFT_185669 [Serpula lacrymans var. lacrymans S7.3]EGO21635.1 hypothetical protein SERLADRAFT_474270 [Serpula lacrymans var. lacrymans S7.9]